MLVSGYRVKYGSGGVSVAGCLGYDVLVKQSELMSFSSKFQLLVV